MDGVLVRVVPLLRDVVGDVVNRDNPVGQDQNHENDECESEIAEEVHGGPNCYQADRQGQSKM
jgi:hypothetical protein